MDVFATVSFTNADDVGKAVCRFSPTYCILKAQLWQACLKVTS